MAVVSNSSPLIALAGIQRLDLLPVIFETVKRYARQHDLRNITTVPYQPLESLGASLSSADLHVVVMGNPFVGLVHPCKVYNIRALGIPYLYIGPDESHVTDLVPTFAAKHGDVTAVVRHVEQGERSGLSRVGHFDDRPHSQKYLVGKMVATLEDAAFAPAVLRPSIARAGGSRQL